MAISVGDVVKFADSGRKGEIGRVCKDNGIKILKEVGIVGNSKVLFRKNLFSNIGIYLLEK